MSGERIILTAPDHWATFLINGDSDNLSHEDRRAAQHWLEREGVARVLTTHGAAYFTQRLDLHCPEAGALSGTVLDYVCELKD
jgi:hypothetical protein